MDLEFEYLFGVEAAIAVLLCDSAILYGPVLAERRQRVDVDRLDGLLSDWVAAVSDDHHQPNTMQPSMTFARYL
jgi:hypothetical protein